MTSTWPGTSLARSVRRDAEFTASPITVYSNRDSSPMLPATTSPVATPMPAPTSGTSAVSRSAMARAAARACAAWSSSATGAPKIASTASPMNLLTRPL